MKKEKPVAKPKETVKAAAEAPKQQYMQFELGLSDLEYLGKYQYSAAAWEMIGRRHGVDPTTRVPIDTAGKVFEALPKRWEPLPPPDSAILSTKLMANADAPPPVVSSGADVDKLLAGTDLTKPEAFLGKTEL